MTTAGQLWSAYLLNAVWQPLVLIGLAIAVCQLKPDLSARIQHNLWKGVSALSPLLPLGTLLGLWYSGNQSSPESSSLTVSELSIQCASVAAVSLTLWRLWTLLQEFRKAKAFLKEAHPVHILPQADHPYWFCRSLLPKVNFFVSGDQAAQFGPVTVGILRPVIILPEFLFRSHDDQALIAASVHELAHIRRRDLLWVFIIELVLLPLAFHPVVGYLRRRLAVTRELACDELVVRDSFSPEAYAQALLEVANGILMPRPATGQALGVMDGPLLELRVRRMMAASGHAEFGATAYISLIGVTALIAFCLLLCSRSVFVWLNPLPVPKIISEHIPPPPPPPPGR